MTLIVFVAIGMVAGWLIRRTMSGDGYGTPIDFAVAVGAAVLTGFIFKAALGGWVAASIAALCIASACVFGMRQFKNIHDKQQAEVLARVAMRRRQARAR